MPRVAPVNGGVKHPEGDVVGARGLEHRADVSRRAQQVQELLVDSLRLRARVAWQRVVHVAL